MEVKESYKKQWYEKKKAENPCHVCGQPTSLGSLICRKCFVKDIENTDTDNYTDCPTCDGKMSVHRVQCVSCARSASSGVARVGNGRGRTIHAYLAGGMTSIINSDTLVQCWYWRTRRLAILAPSQKVVRAYLMDFYGQRGADLTHSVCRLSAIDINLTDIDLSQFNGAIP
jgi:hypothetical protein